MGLLEIDEPYAPLAAKLGSERKKLLAGALAAFLLLTGGFVWLLLAATDRLKRRVGIIERDAGRDPLTGLPNRVMFRRLTEEALLELPEGRHLGVVLLDLDRFKEINDALGHFNGDLVLKRLGGRIAALLREGDVVARLGGDEFAILLPGLHTRESARQIADRISEALREPFTASGLALEVEASMGIAIFPNDGEDAEDLLRAADVAMYAAKRQHLSYLFHAADQHRYRPEQLGLAAELRRAIDSGEILLHYQPKVCLQTNEVQGVEALVRWQHRHQGLLFPDSFIPVTEHTSLIHPLTSHVVELALSQVLQWREQGIDLKVAVNLSAQMLLDNDFPREVAKLTFDLHAPQRLEVEVTESSIMQDPRRAAALLGRLRDLGVTVSIDDFGTGYSSLAALKQLPVDTLKIDKSFVMGMEENQDDEAIVEATSRLGQNLGLTVVGEGVESEEAARKLAGFGCHQGQGYYFSKPVEAAVLGRWVLAYREMFPVGSSGRTGAA
jgi:diguanylate cyclase (GGDEF)-like protein